MQVGNNTTIYHPEKSVILPGAVFGDNCKVHAPVWIGDVTIGDNCKVQALAFIPTGVTIGSNVFIGPHVCFTNDRNPPSMGTGWEETTVKDGVIIGANATILPGITLGAGCVIGAGAVVTKSVPDGFTMVGNPATTLYDTRTFEERGYGQEAGWVG